MRVKRLVKLKFASAQDVAVVERLADLAGLEFGQLVMQALQKECNRMVRELEQAQQARVKSDGKATVENVSGVDDSRAEANSSAALANSQDNSIPVP